MTVSRRSLLAGMASATAIPLAACSGGSGQGSPTGGTSDKQQISAFWWGSSNRADLTRQAFNLYTKQNPNYTVQGQYLSFDDYFDKLATLAASNSMPDLLQTNPGSLTQYGTNGQLMDLSTLSLDLGDYEQAALKTGQFNGKQYGLAFGYQYVTTYYNSNLVKTAGTPVPDASTTWDGWADYATTLQSKLPSGVYAFADSSSDSNAFESWMVGRGKSLYTTDGKLGYTVDDASAWFSYWTALRGNGAIAPSAESTIYVQSGSVTDSPLTKGKAALNLGINVGFQGYQKVNQDTLALAACPVGNSRRGETNHFFGWSVYSKTKVPDAIKAFLEFWFTDTKLIQILGTDRALPASKKQLQALNTVAKGATKVLLEFSLAHPEIKPFSPPPTPAAVGNRGTDALQRAAVAVVTGSSKPDAAAKTMVGEIEKALGA